MEFSPALLKSRVCHPRDGTLDKKKLEVCVDVCGIRTWCKHVVTLQQEIDSQLFLNVPRCKRIIRESDQAVMLLHPNVQMQEFSVKWTSTLQKYNAELVFRKLVFGYDYWTTEDILDMVLPQHLRVIACFETVGHIAHLNLVEKHEPFEQIIGQVILDKNPCIRTVVSKKGQIENRFRVFPMKLIAGEPRFIAIVRQHGCLFQLDYSRVYWNSRLEHEHSRLAALFDPGQTVADVFCGVGPFSIPAAKKNCLVYSNDLNPVSFYYLKENAVLNKVHVQAFNMDGRQFIIDTLSMLNPTDSKDFMFFHHYVLNLPASAHTFLDVFVGIAGIRSVRMLPTIHCYLFVKTGHNPLDPIEQTLGCRLENAAIHHVRKVSPSKDMVCISFVLPERVAVSNK